MLKCVKVITIAIITYTYFIFHIFEIEIERSTSDRNCQKLSFMQVLYLRKKSV